MCFVCVDGFEFDGRRMRWWARVWYSDEVSSREEEEVRVKKEKSDGKRQGWSTQKRE
jgi:hypothetical protein